MALPKQIQRQIEEADRLAREQASAEQPEDEVDTGETGADEVEDASTDTPDGDVVQTPPTDWENRYRTLQGKYDSEVPRLSQSVQRLESQLQEQRTLFASLNKAEKRKETEEPAAVTTRLVSESEIDDYGPDAIDVMRRVAREEAEPLRQQNAELRRQLQEARREQASMSTQVTQSREQQMKDILSREVEDWTKLNDDPDFIAWVDEQDPYAGATRRTLLQDAWNKGEIQRVVAFFQGYKREHTAVTPAPTKGSPAGRPSLESLAAPRRGSPGAEPTGAPQEGRIWTQTDIANFYRDVQRGRFSGREAEQRKLEQDIFAANREGRIR
jgi:hypothetical protein